MKNYTITVNGTPYSVTVEEGTSSAPVATTAPVAAAPAPAARGRGRRRFPVLVFF